MPRPNHLPCYVAVSRGADRGTRTRDLLFTKQLLCRLSYIGTEPNRKCSRRLRVVPSVEERVTAPGVGFDFQGVDAVQA